MNNWIYPLIQHKLIEEARRRYDYVTTTELLSGKRIKSNTHLDIVDVEVLMNRTIDLSKEELEQQNKNKKNRKIILYACSFIVILEIILIVSLGYTWDSLYQNLFTVELLMLIFGIYFTLFAKETLPVYYDENTINFYHDGIFKMNVPGVKFNNSNWKYILYVAYTAVMSVFTLFPLLYLGISYVFPEVWEKGQLIFTLGSVFTMFIPIYIVGKKYE